jgi:hypothetical protein
LVDALDSSATQLPPRRRVDAPPTLSNSPPKSRCLLSTPHTALPLTPTRLRRSLSAQHGRHRPRAPRNRGVAKTSSSGRGGPREEAEDEGEQRGRGGRTRESSSAYVCASGSSWELGGRGETRLEDVLRGTALILNEDTSCGVDLLLTLGHPQSKPGISGTRSGKVGDAVSVASVAESLEDVRKKGHLFWNKMTTCRDPYAYVLSSLTARANPWLTIVAGRWTGSPIPIS